MRVASLGGGFNLSGPTTYEIYLNAFSGSCGGADSGYVSVPETRLLGFHSWLIPINVVVGPAL